jgi:hypothetical protein
VIQISGVMSVREHEEQVAALKALCVRAADALEIWSNSVPGPTPSTCELIAQLRKAAK